jgi:hypothetical protein
VHLDHRCTSVEQDQAQVRVIFDKAEPKSGTVAIAADGAQLAGHR